VSAEAAAGTTLLDVAEAAGAYVGHSCGGVCGCSTCHVLVKAGLESLSEQEDAELDRLEKAFDVKPNSRLACQAEVGDEPLEVWITQESLSAYMDENPILRRELEAKGLWPIGASHP
jgi:2Fe-2S ferredoxin